MFDEILKKLERRNSNPFEVACDYLTWNAMPSSMMTQAEITLATEIFSETRLGKEVKRKIEADLASKLN